MSSTYARRMMLVLWSSPRSRSTAFFRMMIERGDFVAVHEPFSYLAEFGHVDVDGTRLTSAPELLAGLRSLAARRPVFIKETTGRRYPEVLADRQFMAQDARHTFLIRHPRETIASRRVIDPRPTLEKIGFESQYEVFAAAAAATSTAATDSAGGPVVIDSADLVARPAAIIAAYCERVGIDFRPEALTWEPSDRPEWELSRSWHSAVAASSGFGHVPGPDRGAPDSDIEQDRLLGGYLNHHLPFYQRLYARRLMA
jgi:Sulfotransferase domain